MIYYEDNVDNIEDFVKNNPDKVRAIPDMIRALQSTQKLLGNLGRDEDDCFTTQMVNSALEKVGYSWT